MTKRSADDRLFHRIATQRLEDAEILFNNGRTTGAIYLGGYAVECLLKAMLLASTPARSHARLIGEFRGGRAHNYDALRQQYRRASGAPFPPEIAEAFTRVNSWGPDMRYNASVRPRSEAAAFLGSVQAIRRWSEGRLGYGA